MERSVKTIAAIVHDMGKVKTLHFGEDGDAHAFGHEAETTAAKLFMQKIGVPTQMRKQALALTEHHMKMKSADQVSSRQVVRLIKALAKVDLTIFDWWEFHQMDARGKHINPHSESADLVLEIAKPILEQAELPKPLVTGGDLIKIGMRPSKQFGVILAALFEAQCIENLNKDQLLDMIPEIIEGME